MTDLLAGRRQGQAFGDDLRRRAVAAVLDEGMTRAAAGRRFGVHPQNIGRWVKRYRERGHLRPDARGGDLRSSRIEAERDRVFRLLERRPGLSIRALRDALAREGAVFGFGAVQRFLKRHGLERASRLAHRPTGAGRRASS